MTDPQGKPGGESEILIFQSEDGRSRIQVRLEDKTVWLTQALLERSRAIPPPRSSRNARTRGSRYAEAQAERRQPLYMKDWREKLDAFLKFNEKQILEHPGKVSIS